MPTCVYKQGLDTIATQVKTLADAIDTTLVPETAIMPRKLDWDDLQNFPGVALCWSEDVDHRDSLGTSDRDARAYPAYIIMKAPQRFQWDNRQENLTLLKQNLARYFNHKRRLGAVSDTGTNQFTCRVLDSGPTPPRRVRAKWDVHTLTILMWLLEPRTA